MSSEEKHQPHRSRGTDVLETNQVKMDLLTPVFLYPVQKLLVPLFSTARTGQLASINVADIHPGHSSHPGTGEAIAGGSLAQEPDYCSYGPKSDRISQCRIASAAQAL